MKLRTFNNRHGINWGSDMALWRAQKNIVLTGHNFHPHNPSPAPPGFAAPQISKNFTLGFAPIALAASIARTATLRIAPQFQPSEAAELCWRTGPGPGYSRSLAERHLHSRYETTTRGLRVTLPRIVKDNRCRRLLLRIRAEGLLDWQILSALLAMVAKWQVEAKLGRPISPTSDSWVMMDRAFREEQDDDPPFDLSVLTEQRMRMQLKLSIPAAFNTWGLMSHRRTPDFDAMKRLLDERYQHSADDIPHPDPLARGHSVEVAETIIL
jgi:hypothetical protein